MRLLKTIGERIPFLAWAIAVSALLHWLIITLTPLVTIPESISSNERFTVQLNLVTSEKQNTLVLANKTIKSDYESESPPNPSRNSETSERTYPSLIEKYYEVQELDVIPEPMVNIEPNYPESALAEGITGIVRLEIFIDEKGYVESVRLSPPRNPDIFDQAAIEAFAHQRFTPAEKNGLKVKSRLKLVVDFGHDFTSN